MAALLEHQPRCPKGGECLAASPSTETNFHQENDADLPASHKNYPPSGQKLDLPPYQYHQKQYKRGNNKQHATPANYPISQTAASSPHCPATRTSGVSLVIGHDFLFKCSIDDVNRLCANFNIRRGRWSKRLVPIHVLLRARGFKSRLGHVDVN